MRVMLVFLLAYGLVALRDHSHEVFPFFAWSLFSTVPTPQNGDFDVRILSAQGLPRPGPIYFEDANLQPGAQEVQGQAALQSLGRLTLQHENRRARTVRKRFESVYLRNLSHVRYQLVQRRWDIRKRVTCRSCFTDIRVLGTYSAK
jgi:hypothetical protein